MRPGLTFNPSPPFPPLLCRHGVTFALGWAAATQYMAHLLPPELSSSAQGLLAGIQWGFGASMGSLFGGMVQTAFGWRVMWRVGSAMALVGLLLMCWEIRREGRAAGLVQLEQGEDGDGEQSGGNSPASASSRKERFSDADMVSTVPQGEGR